MKTKPACKAYIGQMVERGQIGKLPGGGGGQIGKLPGGGEGKGGANRVNSHGANRAKI